MSKALIITALPFVPLFEQELDGLDDYQRAVGGFIEPVALREPSLTMYVNENGQSGALVPNLRATALWWLVDPEVRRRDVILGTAVLTAEPGDVRAAEFLTMVQSDRCFQIEVQTRENGAAWIPAPNAFDNWFAAAIHALIIEQDWHAVRGVRVVPV